MIHFKKVFAIFTIFTFYIQIIESQIVIDTQILTTIEKSLLYRMINRINPINPSLNLLYRASRDGFDASSFHSLCDNHSNTVVIIKSRLTNNVFGAVNYLAWSSNTMQNDSSSTPNAAFLYSLRRAGFSEFSKYWQDLGNQNLQTNIIVGDPNLGPRLGQTDLMIAYGNCWMLGW